MGRLEMKSKSIQLGILTLVAMLSIGTSCEPAERLNYDRGTLLGSWKGITLEGEGELTFGVEGGIYFYTFMAMSGSFSERSISGDILSQGTWGLNQSILTLVDDQIDAYYTCVATDQFDLNLNTDATIMTMTHLSSECVERGQLLENALWYKQVEGE